MHYVKRQNLVSRVLTTTGLVCGLAGSGCYLTAEEGLGAALDVLGASGVVKDPIVNRIISKGSDLSYKAGERRTKHQSELKEADVDIYREEGLSKIKINESKAYRNLDNEASSNSPKQETDLETQKVMEDVSKGSDLSYKADERNSPKQETDLETQKVMEDVLGRKSTNINYKIIIDAVEKEYLTNPKDYERNLDMIDKVINKEGLTFSDKNRLTGILRGMLVGIVKSNLYDEDIEGKIKVLHYVISNPSIESSWRNRAITLYGRCINKKASQLPKEKAVQLLKDSILFYPEIKGEVSHSQTELSQIDFNREGGINKLESILRDLLSEQNPGEFRFKEDILEDTVRAYEKALKEGNEEKARALITPEIIELAKDIGLSIWFLDKINMNVEEILKQRSNNSESLEAIDRINPKFGDEFARELERLVNNVIKSNSKENNSDEKLKILEYCIDSENISSRLRTKAIKALNFYTNIAPQIKGDNAVDFLREKISLLERVLNGTQLSERDINFIYNEGIDSLELILRKKLMTKNPEGFRIAIKRLDEIMNVYRRSTNVKEAREVITPQVRNFARGIGYSAWLREKTRRIVPDQVINNVQEDVKPVQKEPVIKDEPDQNIEKLEQEQPKNMDKEEVTNETHKEEDFKQTNLRNYIKSSLKRGVDDEKIKEFLLTVDYSKEQINSMFEEVKSLSK